MAFTISKDLNQMVIRLDDLELRQAVMFYMQEKVREYGPILVQDAKIGRAAKGSFADITCKIAPGVTDPIPLESEGEEAVEETAA